MEIDADHLVLLHGEEQISIAFEDMDYAKSVIDWQRPRSGKEKKNNKRKVKLG